MFAIALVIVLSADGNMKTVLWLVVLYVVAQ
jgi:hypothetical protein